MKICGKHVRKFHLFGVVIFLNGAFMLITNLLQSRIFLHRATLYYDRPKLYTIQTEGCRIPAVELFAEPSEKYIFKELPLICNQNKPPLVEADEVALYISNGSLAAYGIRDTVELICCYRGLRYHNDTHMKRDYCLNFQNGTVMKDEYVRVTCFYEGKAVYVDFFSFVQIQPTLRERIKRSSKPSILIIGIDGVSRPNLHRQMPTTVKSLQEIEALEFLGYNKVADNTFPNLVPVLSGLYVRELDKYCNYRKGFDSCPFIWKNFADNGFLTALGEDAANLGLFVHWRAGFAEQPTDYYWSPFDYIMEKEIGNSGSANVFRCVGGRPTYKVLLNYIERFALTMHRERLPYFAFFWGSTLSHDLLNQPRLGDNDYALLFRKLKAHGVLQNTILIFMSDHGLRWGEFRLTLQGRLEENLPFLFINLPESLKNAHRYAFNNLVQNTKKLTTPFDLHLTLRDLVDYRRLSNWHVIFRKVSRAAYSLFENIPQNRTCREALIALNWCACTAASPEPVEGYPTRFVAKFVVAEINKMLEPYETLCEKLVLSKIKSTYRVVYWTSADDNDVKFRNVYTITIQTSPGHAIFEATVREHFENNTYGFKFLGTVSRISLYKNLGDCVHNASLQLYCHCKTK